ncbi:MULTISPECIES: hypothetical protein [unclassified Streptomyces]|uniref:hypothetical protein n=1 Tax=unclassified Streptomyces TaxID=2593676 RepID=UPI0004CB7BC2|nr:MULTISPECIES: hypothetical protein [unclassified Streptomyces]KJY22186.1 hypothetical protein VR43_07395 [Streptomyces sp. NRRL S-104]
MILVSGEAGSDLVAGVSGAPTPLPVQLPEQWREVPTVTRSIEEQLGCPVFLRTELPLRTGRADRMFVAEVADRRAPGLSHLTWFPARDRLLDIAALFTPAADAKAPSGVGALLAADTFETPHTPWTSAGWYDGLGRELAAYFGEPADIRPLKLRHDRYLLRVACNGEFYEVHAKCRLAAPVPRRHLPRAALDDAPLLQAHLPAVLARWPHLGAELRSAPRGQRLADIGTLAAWDSAVRDWATSQIAYSEQRDSGRPLKSLLGELREEFDLAVQEWRTVQDYIPGFGDRAFEWIGQIVHAAFTVLDDSRLSASIVNGSLSCHTAYVANSGMQVSEWDPCYLGHPFMNLASLLHARGRAFTSVSQSHLAHPYVATWMKNSPVGDPGAEVRGAIIAGCAMQAVGAWRSTSHPAEVRALFVGAELASWWEIIMRSSA